MNRDSLFKIVRSDNISIELLCDDTCNRNNIVYLPSGLINENPTIEASYEGDIPFGMPLASSFKLTLDTRMISDEQSEIGKWIEENSSPINKKPNVWIVRDGDNIIFAGVQQANQVEEYDVIKAEAEIQCVGIYKIIMESIRVDSVMSASPIDDDLVSGVVNLFDFHNTYMQSLIQLRDCRVKFKKLYDFINLCFGEIESKYHYFMRDYNLVCTWMWTYMPEVLNQQANDGSYITPYIITHVFNDNDDALEPVTGVVTEMQRNYKQLWNFFDELFKGWSYYAKITYSNSNILFTINPVNIPHQTYSINEENLTADIIKHKKKTLDLRVSNMRITKPRDTDIKVITKNINATSLSGKTTESTCILGTEPNTVDLHFAGNPKTAQTTYLIKDNEKPPIMNFFTHYIWDIPVLRAGNQFKICGGYYNQMMFIQLGIDGKDNYNREIRKAQQQGMAAVTQNIRDIYLSNKKEQKSITLSVNKNSISLANLGDKYELDLSNIFNQIPFYKHVVLGTSAMLGKVSSKLNENYIECTFYFQGES